MFSLTMNMDSDFDSVRPDPFMGAPTDSPSPDPGSSPAHSFSEVFQATTRDPIRRNTVEAFVNVAELQDVRFVSGDGGRGISGNGSGNEITVGQITAPLFNEDDKDHFAEVPQIPKEKTAENQAVAELNEMDVQKENSFVSLVPVMPVEQRGDVDPTVITNEGKEQAHNDFVENEGVVAATNVQQEQDSSTLLPSIVAVEQRENVRFAVTDGGKKKKRNDYVKLGVKDRRARNNLASKISKKRKKLEFNEIKTAVPRLQLENAELQEKINEARRREAAAKAKSRCINLLIEKKAS